jgi:enoyl-CoA hydratase/carnithine racemase
MKPLRRDGLVAILELADAPTFAALLETLDALNWENQARVVLFLVRGGEEWPAAPSPQDLIQFERTALPLVAALSGHVAGAALDVALACDIRIGDETLSMQFGSVGTRRMTTLLGIDRQVRLLENRLRCDAQVALELGLVSAVAPAGEADSRALQLAETIASRGPIATRLAKEALSRGLELPLEQALRFETDLTLLLQTTKDRAEGVHAFLEKRQPAFMGD